MVANKNVKKIEQRTYNSSSGDFIPIACHLDNYTLITKNGELIQTFEINGINSEKISKTLFNLRKVVRDAIRNNVDTPRLAFWIHTIRRNADLDDYTPYNNYFSANVHDIWSRKNYWHDKFVNRLYISVVHDSPKMNIKDFNSAVNSLSRGIVAKFEENFHDAARAKLTSVVDKIIEHLSEYGAEKLGIRIEKDGCYSDLMFLYRRIMQLNEEECLLPIADISSELASHQYAVGTDMIEVIDENSKKFAAIISIKEYQEVSSDALDKFLQIPVEMVATEVFYFVDRKEVMPDFQHQVYILSVSKDEELKKLKGLEQIANHEEENNKFCHQQISFMVIGDDIQELEQKISQASDTLSKIGIVHVREDVNLEKMFWSQLPGNFAFLSRMSPTILSNTAALASLHNFPTGNQYNPWGRALTLLRTEKGTPYFMNFHDSNEDAFTCIFGGKKSGKTTLMNFLLSESDKFQPTILHFVDDLDSGIFVKARGGSWFQRQQNVINPFIIDDNQDNRNFLLEFFKIISNHHFDPLEDSEMGLIKLIIDRAFKLETKERKLSSLIEQIKESDKGGKVFRNRMAKFMPGGDFYLVFERSDSLELSDGGVISFNLQSFDDAAFHKQNFPKEKKLIEQFEYDLSAMRSIKAGIIYASITLLQSGNKYNPKILAIDNIQEIINLDQYSWLIERINEMLKAMNGVLFVTASIEAIRKIYHEKKDLNWINLINTKIILPPDIKIMELKDFINISKEEADKLFALNQAARSFLISQDGKTIASELSIGGLPGLVKIFCSGKNERDLYRKHTESLGLETEKWVEALYNELDEMV